MKSRIELETELRRLYAAKKENEGKVIALSRQSGLQRNHAVSAIRAGGQVPEITASQEEVENLETLGREIDEAIETIRGELAAIDKIEALSMGDQIQAEANRAFVEFAQSVKTLHDSIEKLQQLRLDFWHANPRGMRRELETYGLDLENYLLVSRRWLGYMAGRQKLTELLESAGVDIDIRRKNGR